MASDSDLFQKRIFWGFGKTYSLACEGVDAVALAPSIVRALKNALRGELRCPALNPLIACVTDFVNQSEGSLFGVQKGTEAEFRDRLTAIERRFADYGSTHLARQAVEAAAFDLMRTPGGDVAKACYERLARQLADRYCFAPTECNISKARGFTREQVHKYEDDAFAAAKPGLNELLQQQSYLLDVSPEREAKVMLFSGGLDSYAGAVQQLKDSARFHVLVSGSTHNRMAAEQVAQARILFEGRQALGHHVAVPYGMPTKVSGIRLESSQRARGLVHLSIGVLTALSLGTNGFCIYENGVGALNLPFDASQSGWEISRAVHPYTLRLMEELVSEITEENFHIQTPFLFSTKAESLMGAEMIGFRRGISYTFSCDRFPNYRERRRQCGVCSSCVLRRLALEVAGFAEVEPPGEYTHDITSNEFVPHANAAFILDKFDSQAHRMHRCLDSMQPWLEMTGLFPELRDVEFALTKQGIGTHEVQANLLTLYRRHVDQWNSFSGRAALHRYLRAA